MANEQAIVDKAAENELLNNRERAQRRMEFLDTQNKENESVLKLYEDYIREATDD